MLLKLIESSPTVGTSCSFLMESTIFSTSNTCVSSLNTKSGRDFVTNKYETILSFSCLGGEKKRDP